MTIDRREILQMALAGTALPTAVGAEEPVPSPTRKPADARKGARPNILVIVLDDVGYADLGCYGSEIRTPNIDALARRGAKFTCFHTAPLCSPTRASLLTGLNPHMAGVGTIADWATDHAGYRGTVRQDIPMLPALLSARGYSCYGSGKWHLTSLRDQGPAGPFKDWPTQRGFDRWYGFQGFNSDQFHPELFDGTSPVEIADKRDYHLSADIVDRMSSFLSEHVSNAPDTPFFAYLAFGACHWPLQVPKANVDRVRGRYDAGWNEVRSQRYRRQLDLGLLPPSTQLPADNADVPRWSSLSGEERAFAARLQEVYAAFLEHADEQIGHLLASLDQLGVADDTLIFLLSDNGATAEGAQIGMSDVKRALYLDAESSADRIDALPLLGSDRSYPEYPLGWAEASNTPLKWYKSTTHEGGIRTPLIVSWPKAMAADDRWRRQFHHVSDVAPTIMDLLGAPTDRFEGTSFAYALRDPATPTRKRTQIFESTGSRALWKDGWKAVARHVRSRSFEADPWELYHLDSDFSEAVDLATSEPRRLALLKAAWLVEAARGQILPLEDRRMEVEPLNWPKPRDRYVYYARTRVDRLAMPDTARAHVITADLVLPPDAAGVLVAAGGLLRGYELFVADGLLHYVYLERRDHAHRIAAAGLPTGRCRISVALGDGAGPRRVEIAIDGKPRASGRLPASWPIHALSAGLRCGWNPNSPISQAYAGSFPFNGTIERLAFDMK